MIVLSIAQLRYADAELVDEHGCLYGQLATETCVKPCGGVAECLRGRVVRNSFKLE